MQIWTEKYRPQKISDLIGQEAIRDLISFIKKKEHILICGPVGCGKTAAVNIITNELGYEIVELNASDFRNKNQIDTIIGQAVKQQSLLAKSKIILIDELEGISGRKDRGCINEISKLLNLSSFPIVMICDKLDKFYNLRRKCKVITFKKINYDSIIKILKKICKNEKIEIDDIMLKKIALDSKGDARAAINDLNALNLSGRKEEETIHDALRLIFRSKSANSVLKAFDNVALNLDECLLWIDENLPREYFDEDLTRAYDILSKADIFRGRIRKWQHWHFLVYVNALLTAGITSLNKKSSKNVFYKNFYKKNNRILKIWIAKNAKKEIAAGLAKKCHCSVKKIMTEMPYLEKINLV